MGVTPARWERWLEIAANVSLLLVTLYVAWLGLRPTGPSPPKLKVPTIPLPLTGTQHAGSTSAPVALVIFSDFQCPFCARLAKSTLHSLMTKYVDSGKVLIGFRHFPNEVGHPLAMGAATAAYCAGVQGKFWQMHDLLFQNSGSISTEALKAHLDEQRLDTAAFESCRESEAESRVREDMKLGKTLGLFGTPTTFVGKLLTGKEGDLAVIVQAIIPGSPEPVAFEKAIDKALELAGDGGGKDPD